MGYICILKLFSYNGRSINTLKFENASPNSNNAVIIVILDIFMLMTDNKIIFHITFAFWRSCRNCNRKVEIRQFARAIARAKTLLADVLRKLINNHSRQIWRVWIVQFHNQTFSIRGIFYKVHELVYIVQKCLQNLLG